MLDTRDLRSAKPRVRAGKDEYGLVGQEGKNPDKAAERGIAIHGYGRGRTFSSRTWGCIRVDDQTMQQIKSEGKDKNDPVTTITIY
jgi:hypothetical protein